MDRRYRAGNSTWETPQIGFPVVSQKSVLWCPLVSRNGGFPFRHCFTFEPKSPTNRPSMSVPKWVRKPQVSSSSLEIGSTNPAGFAIERSGCYRSSPSGFPVVSQNSFSARKSRQARSSRCVNRGARKRLQKLHAVALAARSGRTPGRDPRRAQKETRSCLQAIRGWHGRGSAERHHGQEAWPSVEAPALLPVDVTP